MSAYYPPRQPAPMQYQFTFTAPARLPPRPSPPSWWTMSPSGLQLTAFPADVPSAPYPNMSFADPYAFPHFPTHPQQAVAGPSTSRAVFGANSASHVPASPSDSIASCDTAPSPPAAYVHVVCNAPLVAPKPLPYHSPTFLQFDLPDDDEDLSHPPYVFRPHKRKRSDDGEEDDGARRFVIMKRRATDDRGAHASGRWGAPGAGTRGAASYMAKTQPRTAMRTQHTHSHTLPAIPGVGQYAQRHR